MVNDTCDITGNLQTSKRQHIHVCFHCEKNACDPCGLSLFLASRQNVNAWVIDNLKPVQRELESSIRELLRRAIVCKLASVSRHFGSVTECVVFVNFFSFRFKDQWWALRHICKQTQIPVHQHTQLPWEDVSVQNKTKWGHLRPARWLQSWYSSSNWHLASEWQRGAPSIYSGNA